MFKDKTIESRVMKAVRNKIAEKQKLYEDGVKSLEAKLEQDKSDLADKLVDSIIGKF